MIPNDTPSSSSPEVSGTTKKQFILLRGLCREAGHWGVLPNHLEKHFSEDEVHCLDLPGNGIFHQQLSPVKIDDYAEHLNELIQNLPHSDNRYFIGVSFGAMVGLQYRNQFPGEIKKFFLINTSHGGLSPFWQRMKFKYYPLILSLPLFPSLEKKLLDVVCNLNGKNAKTAKKWMQIRKERPVRPLSFIKQLRAAAAAKPELIVNQDDLIILSSIQDRFVSPQCSKVLAKTLKAPMETHDTAGHDLPEDAPEWTLQQIVEYLA